MKVEELSLKPFSLNELSTLSFGKLEGENDYEILNTAFITTKSVNKFLKMDQNYVLSPKGAGKSALCNSINKKIIPDEDFSYDKYIILAINEAFGFDDKYLSVEINFKKESTKTYIFAWSMYLINKIVSLIINKYSTYTGFSEFKLELSQYIEFKNDYELYTIMDYIKELKVGLSFNISGQSITINPVLATKEKPTKVVNLNNIFNIINTFLKTNKLDLLIMIDRVDNFVKSEIYQIQKRYIQGLIDCIEEIRLLSNVKIVLFLRTDLFFSLDLNIEFDKAKDRIMYLEWQKYEILQFIVKRLISNNYINENYSSFINKAIMDEIQNMGVHSLWEKIKIRLKKNIANKNFDANLYYRVYEKFIKLFFPNTIENNNNIKKSEPYEFCSWLFEYFTDQNNYLNPRVIVSYFNTLFTKQLEKYENDPLLLGKHANGVFDAEKIDGYIKIQLFDSETMLRVYSIIQNDELKTIHFLLRTPKEKKLFREINKVSYKNGEFKKDMINIKKNHVTNDEYNSLIKYLSILGFFKQKQGTSNVFTVPNLFRRNMEIEHEY